MGEVLGNGRVSFFGLLTRSRESECVFLVTCVTYVTWCGELLLGPCGSGDTDLPRLG